MLAPIGLDQATPDCGSPFEVDLLRTDRAHNGSQRVQLTYGAHPAILRLKLGNYRISGHQYSKRFHSSDKHVLDDLFYGCSVRSLPHHYPDGRLVHCPDYATRKRDDLFSYAHSAQQYLII